MIFPVLADVLAVMVGFLPATTILYWAIRVLKVMYIFIRRLMMPWFFKKCTKEKEQSAVDAKKIIMEKSWKENTSQERGKKKRRKKLE